jgi:hypothetical protein
MSGTPQKICPQCHQSADVHASVCGRCGRVYRTQFANAVQPTQILTPHAPPPPPGHAFACACTVCGNAQVQTVTAICQEGQWSAVTSMQTTGVAFDMQGHSALAFGGGTAHNFGSTQLAAMLAPPPLPSFRNPEVIGTRTAFIIAMAVLAFFTLIFAAPYWASARTDEELPLGALLFGAGSLACFMVALSVHRQCGPALRQAHWHFDQAVEMHRQQIATWQQLYYCSRCDHVYNPLNGQAAQTAYMYTLL